MAKKKTTRRARGAKTSGKKKVTRKSSGAKVVKTKSAKKSTKKKAAKKKAAKKKTTKASAAKKTTKAKAAGKKKSAGKKRSTKSKASKAKPTKRGAAAKPLELKRQKGTIKTHLSRKELVYYRNLLLLKRAELLGDMSSMSEEALNSESTDLSHVPIHMADVGSENHDKELMLGLAESERKTIREIDDALTRIAEGTYGVCEATGKRITKPRLEAKPWAKYCIEAAREIERRGPLT